MKVDFVDRGEEEEADDKEDKLNKKEAVEGRREESGDMDSRSAGMARGDDTLKSIRGFVPNLSPNPVL